MKSGNLNSPTTNSLHRQWRAAWLPFLFIAAILFLQTAVQTQRGDRCAHIHASRGT